MTDAFETLFIHCCGHVTPEIIRRYCMGDPGYWGYVSACDWILEHRRLPLEWDVDIEETINLAQWDESIEPEAGRFRSFTHSIALWGRSLDEASLTMEAINYMLVLLVKDTLICRDREQAALVIKACELYRLSPSLPRTWPEYVDGLDEAWFLLTELLLQSLTGTADFVERKTAELLELVQSRGGECDDGNCGYPDLSVLDLSSSYVHFHTLWADLVAWCLAPFVAESPSCLTFLKSIDVWRRRTFTEEHLQGVPPEAREIIYEMERRRPAGALPHRTLHIPELNGALRQHFRGAGNSIHQLKH